MQYKMTVPVFSRNLVLLHYTKPARARMLVRNKKAVKIYKDGIFAIELLKNQLNLKELLHTLISSKTEWSIGIDPGVKYTGLALYRNTISALGMITRIPVILINLEHRNDISRNLEKRRLVRAQRRKRKRNKVLRVPRMPIPDKDGTININGDYDYKPLRDKSNTDKEGWLPPSIVARMESIVRWVRVLSRYSLQKVNTVHLEDLYFTPELSREIEDSLKEFGLNNDRGIHSSTKRSYIHWLYNYRCQYCGYDFLKNNWSKESEIDHIYPRSKGGNSSIENLILSCHDCNHDKKDSLLSEWLPRASKKRKPYISRIIKKLDDNKKPATRKYGTLATITRHWFPKFLRDNVYSSTEIDYYNWLNGKGVYNDPIEVEVSAGYNTKITRDKLKLPKDHCVDALCVDSSIDYVKDTMWANKLSVRRRGRRDRQFVKMNASGFPRLVKTKDGYRTMAPKQRCVRGPTGLSLWDLVYYDHPKHGTGMSYITSVRAVGDIFLSNGITSMVHNFNKVTVVSKSNGYTINA